MKPCPCRDCGTRYSLCWNTCEPYKEWRAEKDRINAIRQHESKVWNVWARDKQVRNTKWHKHHNNHK